ncbi:MAG TPA: glycoside hydrolase family 2 TIM barrel-domain containing protein [Chthonomonadales bacterium]|nr:glycoside hydrolase family 2 TIM barrel-domain containing protein [Chthonomonadales bacterium]
MGSRWAIRASLAVALLALAWGAFAAPSRAVWVEAETAEAVTGADVRPSPSRPGVLSGGQWMTFTADRQTAPADGVAMTLRFSAPEAGRQRLWARLGFEWVRANMEVRLNGGEWSAMPADQATTNVVELGVWAEIAWARGPVVELAAGPNTLDIRFTRPENSDRLLFGLDCVAFIPEGMAWTPDGALQPGQSYDEPIDRRAANVVHVIRPAASPGARVEQSLDGLWQVARYDDPDMNVGAYDPVRALPAASDGVLHWRGVRVPADAWTERADLSFGHRLVYRTRVEVPASLAGRSFLLRFGGHAWITSVFVNGVLAGERQTTLVPFDIDLTRALRPGQVNTIDICIKGSYYAIDHQPGQLMRSRNWPRTEEFLRLVKWIDCTWPTGKGGGDSAQTGLTRSVRLVVAGPVYTSDAFVRTSVTRRRIEADIELTNPSPADAEVQLVTEAVHERSGAVEKRFAPVVVRVPAGGKADARLAEGWANPKLWWPAESRTDRPHCYLLRTTLLIEGRPVDIRTVRFGFRELGVDGRHVTLNGVRWRPHSWNSLGGGGYGGTDIDAYFRWNDRGVRMEGGVHTEFYDVNGIPGRLSMAWEGMFGQVAMNNPRMWQNWKLHVEQMVRAYRNSPSVFHWSIGNEVQMITGRLFFSGEIGRHERQIAEVFAVAKRLDPTRTVSEDGAGDLGGLGDSNNWHYVMNEFKVPRQFYEYPVGPASPQREGVDFQTLYRWDGNRPLVQGEEFYFAGMGNFAWFGGPRVYRGKRYRDAAGGRYGRIKTEGARWQGVFKVNPCQGPLPGIERSMAAQAVFVREHNSVFRPGARVTRTIKVFNDTRRDAELTLRWRTVFGRTVAGQGTRRYTLRAGLDQQDVLTLRMPAATGRLDGRLELELLAAGRRVFFDTRRLSVLPSLPPVSAPAQALAVWDPRGAVAAWLTARRQPMTRVQSLEGLPNAALAVLVGPGALTDENRRAAAAALRAFVARGRTAIVLEQSSPLREDDLPTAGVVVADREKGRAARPEWEKVGGHTGAIAHPIALAHRVLANLQPDDFFTWAGADQLCYRLSHATPQTGSVNLVQAGEDLSLAPLFELVAGRGSMLISQLLIGEKLASEPVAERLLSNSIAWALGRGRAAPKRTVVVAGGDAAFAETVRGLGIAYTPSDDVGAALAADVAVVRATPASLSALAGRAAAVRAMAQRGGWLVLAGLDEGGLEAFNRLVGVQHRLRPFRKEGVLLAAPEDALAMGISDRDLRQIDPEVIAPWMGLHRVSGRVFTSVVDASDDIASFVGLSAFAEGSDRPLTDGLTIETFWRYTQYISAAGTEPIVLTLDRPEPLTALEVFQSEAYLWAREVEVSVDGRSVRRVTLRNERGWQRIELPGTPARQVSLRLLSTYPPTRQVEHQLVTIDEVRLLRRLPAGFAARVVPLTTPAGIVKYPIGRGGILLCQLDLRPGDLPENAAKKRIIFSSLLRNAGSAFRD